jgi:DNA-binding NtrC family response regulator
LLVENSKADAKLIVHELRKEGLDLDFVRVNTPQDLEAALDENNWDAVIADYGIPEFTGLEALRIIHDKGLDLPFILVSGSIGEKKAVDAMRAGAHDFILKGNFPRLVPALERELRQAKVLRERRQALEKLSVIFHEHSPTWFSNPFTQARRAELVR